MHIRMKLSDLFVLLNIANARAKKNTIRPGALKELKNKIMHKYNLTRDDVEKIRNAIKQERYRIIA